MITRTHSPPINPTDYLPEMNGPDWPADRYLFATPTRLQILAVLFSL